MACLILGLGLAASGWAADLKLPDIAGSATPSKAAQAQEKLRKDAICTKCHDESESAPVLSLYQTKHGVRGDARTPACQNCHGDSEKHVKGDPSNEKRPKPDVVYTKKTYEKSDETTRADKCMTCHKGTKRAYWEGGKHQVNGMACNDCHTVHQPQDKLLSKKTQPEVCFNCHKEQRADTHKVSTHPIEAGKVTCSDCHNPHGSAGPKLLKKNTVNETCWNCHAEKRGPFLWEHQPVTEDCANCHTPHGSNITPLLKSRPPFLCDECHDGPHASPSVVGPNAAGIGATPSATAPASISATYAGRACLNCHVMVHGSNSPAGAVLQR
jgi:DmsE family decaheme c-type cytochrome